MYTLYLDNKFYIESNNLNNIFDLVLPDFEIGEIRTKSGTPLYRYENYEWFDLRF